MINFRTQQRTPNIQRVAQGQNGNRNALVRSVSPCRSVQPGNKLVKQVKIALPPSLT